MGWAMRTTLTIDDELFAKAVSLAGAGMERSDLLKECVSAFIQRQTARRLTALGGQSNCIGRASQLLGIASCQTPETF